MKILRIKWKDHPVLGNLELDFSKPNKQDSFDTIVFVGENGTGKTTIFQSLLPWRKNLARVTSSEVELGMMKE